MKKLLTLLVVTMMLGVASINCVKAQDQDTVAATDTTAVVDQAAAE